MNVATLRWRNTLLLGLLASTGCAADLKATNNGDGAAESQLSIETLDKGKGLHETTVNASVEGKYKYLDLDKADEVAEDSADWDLAFSRFKIKANGGDSGAGDVVVAKLAGASFENLAKAPTEHYVKDSEQVSSDSEAGDPSYGFLGPKPWYKYESSNHQLTPADYVYVVRSTQGDFFKVKMLSYYDKAGTGGYPRFQWAKLDKPSGEINIEEQSTGSAETSGERQSEAGPGTSGNHPPSSPAAYGCYDVKVHKCACGGDQAACEAAMSAWTDQCACDKKK